MSDMLKNKFLNIFLLLIIPVISGSVFYACNDLTGESAKETIFVNAYLRFMEENLQIKGEMQFLSGDSVLTATAYYPEFVRFQGHSMRQMTTMQSSRYSHSFHNHYQVPYTFAFGGKDLGEFELKLDMQPIANKVSADTIPADRNWTFSWDGDALTEIETLTLLFISDEGKELTLNVIGPTSKSSFSFGASQFEDFEATSAGLNVIKRKHENVKDRNIQARVRTEFYLREIPVVFL